VVAPRSRPAPPGVPVWVREPAPGPGPHHPLTRELVVRAAVQLADAEGVAALSMRRLAADVGVGTMSLYRHVPSKDDLLDLMLDAVAAEIELPARPSGDWRGDLRQLAGQFRDAFRRHPWVLTTPATLPSFGPSTLRLIDFGYSIFTGLGLDIDAAAELYGTVQSYITGFTQASLAEESARRGSGLSDEEWRSAVAPYVQKLVADGHYPTLSRQITDGGPREPERSFEFGLDRVLDGIAVFLSSRE
jgi:AcrR family transcriptional regulator